MIDPVGRLAAFVFLLALACLGATGAVFADANPFARGWTLDAKNSELRYISLKKGNIAETNKFREISGWIDETGKANVRVILNSVETYTDIRNVRMRFLFFQTYRHPTAEISLKIDRGSLNDLEQVRRKVVPMEYSLTLHGRTIRRTESLSLFLIDDNHVSVSNTDPIFIGVTDFDLQDGLKRLERAAEVKISPLAIVSFDFSFVRNAGDDGSGDSVDLASTRAVSAPRKVREWNVEKPDPQTCTARILTLGRLDSVRFDTRGARISQDSVPLLQAYAEALVRCPTTRVSVSGLIAPGEIGSAGLSDQRAQAVIRYLWSRGVQRARLKPGDGGMVTADTAPPGNGRVSIAVID